MVRDGSGVGSANAPRATHGSSGRELCPTGHLQGMQPHKSPRSQRSLFLPRVLQAFLARPPASLCGRVWRTGGFLHAKLPQSRSIPGGRWERSDGHLRALLPT